MFSNDFLERIFANEEMQTIPIGCQSTAVHVFETILAEIKEENPYATISELFSASYSTEFSESGDEFATPN